MKICDSCHRHPATVHSFIVQDGESKAVDLCSTCAQAAAFPGDSASARHDSRCDYCGGQPCSGGTDLLAMAMGLQESKFMCMACSMEFLQYVRGEMRRFPQGLPHSSKIEAIRSLRERADRHMREWNQKER